MKIQLSERIRGTFEMAEIRVFSRFTGFSEFLSRKWHWIMRYEVENGRNVNFGYFSTGVPTFNAI